MMCFVGLNEFFLSSSNRKKSNECFFWNRDSFDSIKNKKAELHTIIDSAKPDIILA